jgi:hypothetical protein
VFNKFGGLGDENKKKKKIIETGKKTIDVQLCKLELVVAYRSIIQFDGDIGKPVRLFIYSFTREPQEEPSYRTVTEFMNPVFAKTSLKRSFSVIENERFGTFGQVFAKTGSINSGTDYYICRLLGGIILLISCAGILEQSMGAIGTK